METESSLAQGLCRNGGIRKIVILNPSLCHPERNEGSRFLAQDKLREESNHFQVNRS